MTRDEYRALWELARRERDDARDVAGQLRAERDEALAALRDLVPEANAALREYILPRTNNGLSPDAWERDGALMQAVDAAADILAGLEEA